jgi:succinate dehydrogenase/fumarate reductase flavoprotein subunit
MNIHTNTHTHTHTQLAYYVYRETVARKAATEAKEESKDEPEAVEATEDEPEKLIIKEKDELPEEGHEKVGSWCTDTRSVCLCV